MSTPRTEAGRALLNEMPNYMDGRPYRQRVILPAILAIEAAPLESIEVNGHQYVHVAACPCQPPMKPIEVDWDAEGTDR